jgi:transposase InsO family protein
MGRKVISMKVIAAVTAFVAGEPVNVSQVCATAGVSRKTFYKWAARYRDEGLVGFEERSRVPGSTPHRTPPEIEILVLGLHAELRAAGLDHGALTLQWHLGRHPQMQGRKVPAAATLHRILVRHGVIEPQPRKRPKNSWHRFEAPAPNEWWQIDAMDWAIATGPVSIFSIIDDHSRVAVRSRAVKQATAVEAWTTFCQGGQAWGLPAGVLSDNGLCFSGKLHRVEVSFEANLRDAGIRPITGRPFHPQTTGKVERFQQTLKKWLRRQRLARSLVELQAQLDQFCHVYNHERPHQGIGRVTPASRWHAVPASTPAGEPLEHPVFPRPTVRRSVRVSASGTVRLDNKISIGLGVEHAGAETTVIIDNQHASIYIDDQLVRHLEIDHNRYYQPTGRRRGGPHRPRLAS